MGQTLGCVTVGVKEQFGKFVHCLPWCIGYQLAGRLSLRVQQLDVRCETKTKDNVFVNVVASVQYRALAADAFYKLSNTKEQIQAYVFDVIRAYVPKLDLDSTFEQKNDIAKAVENELQKAMSAYGFEIVQTLIVDIEPDGQVKRAMNEINAAKILQIKKAEGEAESKYLSGLGVARQRQAIVDGLRDSVLAFSDRQGCHGHDPRHSILRHHQGDWRILQVLFRLHPSWTRRRRRSARVKPTDSSCQD